MPDRVRRIGEKQCGIVLGYTADDDGYPMAHVWWGTRPPSGAGGDGVPVTEWVAELDLEPYPEPVVEPDAVIARQKAEREREVRDA
jgi:hypothetical protein